MKATTPRKVEFVLRKFAMQLKRQKEPLSSDQVKSLSRLSSSCERLYRDDDSKEIDVMNEGTASFYEDLNQ